MQDLCYIKQMLYKHYYSRLLCGFQNEEKWKYMVIKLTSPSWVDAVASIENGEDICVLEMIDIMISIVPVNAILYTKMSHFFTFKKKEGKNKTIISSSRSNKTRKNNLIGKIKKNVKYVKLLWYNYWSCGVWKISIRYLYHWQSHCKSKKVCLQKACSYKGKNEMIESANLRDGSSQVMSLWWVCPRFRLTSHFLISAMCMDRSCIGMMLRIPWRQSIIWGIRMCFLDPADLSLFSERSSRSSGLHRTIGRP